ncbi:ABC transporter substrate-binding protein [Leptolyngbya sp. AN02str]|uniref:ABC transporter substrate-binding protein n=1 Tax=Leptolyngbya sp. AN02str TaxID=3423363 RepID=UPI003D31BB3B
MRQLRLILRQWKRWYAILWAIATCLLIGLTNCTPSQDSTGSSTSPTAAQQVIVFGSVSDPTNLEPGNYEDLYTGYVTRQIYDQLLDAEPGTTELVPSLATEWAASEDGLTWTFTLREGVMFHDGTPFNAEAVKANVERWWDPASPLGFRDAGKNYVIWKALFNGFKGEEGSLLQAVNVVDDRTIQFVLREPFAGFPSAIAAGYFGMASPTAIEQAGADYGTAGSVAVGTGAFQFVEWRTGDRVVLKKNPNYWKEGLPKADQLVIRTIKDASARMVELRTGNIDFTINLSPEQRAEIERVPEIDEKLSSPFNVGYLALNTSYEPFSKPEVRRAIAAAINKPAMIDAFWGGLATTDGHFTPPALSQYQDPNVTDYEYNPEAAKQQLADSGYPNGFDLDLWYPDASGAVFPAPKFIAEAIAADLTDVGIRVNLNTKDWAGYLADRLNPPGFQAFMLAWGGDYGDPDNFYYSHFGPGSTDDIGGWRSDRVITLLNQARQESDESVRATLYAEVDRILFDEALRIPLVHTQTLMAQRKDLQGWVPSPLGAESFETVTK